jgi:hypothetical protein
MVPFVTWLHLLTLHNKRIKKIYGKWLPIVLGCGVTLTILIIMIIQAILTRYKLLQAKSTCQEKDLHIILDGQVDDINIAMECLCTAFDNAKCPNFLHVHVLIPLSYSGEITVWDTDLMALCSSKANYNMFFKDNIHMYKYNYRKRKSMLHHIATLLEELEGVSLLSHVMLLPSLTKLIYGWDENIRKDSLTMPEILVYPLSKTPDSFYDPVPKPGFFVIDPTSLGFEVKEFDTPKQSFSLGLSLRHPIITTKDIWMKLRTAPGEDLALTAFCLELNFNIVHGAKAIGTSLYKNGSNKARAHEELVPFVTSKSLHYLSLSYDGSFTVYGKSILGIHSSDTLKEKISKYGSEAKYHSAKQTILF